MSHMTEENRKKIASMLVRGNSCIEIATEIGVDPTTIAKAIKKNRIISEEAVVKGDKTLCKKIQSLYTEFPLPPLFDVFEALEKIKF